MRLEVVYDRPMLKALAAAAVLGICSLTAVASLGAATYPKGFQQDAEAKLKTAFGTWTKKHLPGSTIKAVSCILPTSGNVLHCTVRVASAPKYRELIVFKIRETLHDSGQMTWVATSHSCTDSKTGKPFAC